jgi:hypothetical protein
MLRTNFLAAICLFLVAVAASSRDAAAARLITIKVSVDGKIVLQGSNGDDGEPDVDAVWRSLKEQSLDVTKAFEDLQIPADAKAVDLKSDAPAGQPGGVVLDVRYGGVAEARTVRIVRGPKDRRGWEWRIHPDDVDRLFDDRSIRRSEAERLIQAAKAAPKT